MRRLWLIALRRQYSEVSVPHVIHILRFLWLELKHSIRYLIVVNELTKVFLALCSTTWCYTSGNSVWSELFVAHSLTTAGAWDQARVTFSWHHSLLLFHHQSISIITSQFRHSRSRFLHKWVVNWQQLLLLLKAMLMLQSHQFVLKTSTLSHFKIFSLSSQVLDFRKTYWLFT